jgi:hypothetical protein
MNASWIGNAAGADRHWRRPMSRLAFVATLAAASALGHASPASPATRNGLIAYWHGGAIWAVTPRGRHPRRIVETPPGWGEAWTPTGRRLV